MSLNAPKFYFLDQKFGFFELSFQNGAFKDEKIVTTPCKVTSKYFRVIKTDWSASAISFLKESTNSFSGMFILNGRIGNSASKIF